MNGTTAPQQERHDVGRNEGFPLNLPPSGEMTWDQAEQALREFFQQSPRSGGENRTQEGTGVTPSTSLLPCFSSAAVSGENPSPVSVLGLWDALLEHEFPLNLPPSGDVSLEAPREQELEALYDEQGGW